MEFAVNSELRRKLGARDRRRLEGSSDGAPIQVMLRLAAPLQAESRATLGSAGLEVLHVVGPVVAGRLEDPALLKGLADLPFVEQIELSSVLFAETPDRQTTTR